MKNILITGTSSGLGLESSIILAKNGYKVYASMKDIHANPSTTDKLKQAIEKHQTKDSNIHNNIEILELDVTKPETIEKAIAHIIAKDGKLDILVNNAGVGFAKTTEQASMEEIEWLTDTNYMGVIRTTKAVLPHMRKARSGHIINITSVNGLVGQPFAEFYCGSKFAIEGYTESLASYITKQFNIQFSLIEPGGIATEFVASVLEKTLTADGKYATGEYEQIIQKHMDGAERRASQGTEATYQTREEVAQFVLKVIKDGESGHAPLRIRTSEWSEDFTRLKTQADPDSSILLNELNDRFF